MSDGEAEADSRFNPGTAYGNYGLGEKSTCMTGDFPLASIVTVFPTTSSLHLLLTINQHDVCLA